MHGRKAFSTNVGISLNTGLARRGDICTIYTSDDSWNSLITAADRLALKFCRWPVDEVLRDEQKSFDDVREATA